MCNRSPFALPRPLCSTQFCPFPAPAPGVLPLLRQLVAAKGQAVEAAGAAAGVAASGLADLAAPSPQQLASQRAPLALVPFRPQLGVLADGGLQGVRGGEGQANQLIGRQAGGQAGRRAAGGPAGRQVGRHSTSSRSCDQCPGPGHNHPTQPQLDLTCSTSPRPLVWYFSFLDRRPDRKRSAAFFPLCSLPPGTWLCGAAAAPSWLRGAATSVTAAAAAASNILSLPDDSREAADSARERALLLLRSASTRAGAGLAAVAGDAGGGAAAGVGAAGGRPLRLLLPGVRWPAPGCGAGRAGEACRLRKLPCCSPPLTDEPSPPPRRLPPVLSWEDLRGMGGLLAAPLACACPACCLRGELEQQCGVVSTGQLSKPSAGSYRQVRQRATAQAAWLPASIPNSSHPRPPVRARRLQLHSEACRPQHPAVGRHLAHIASHLQCGRTAQAAGMMRYDGRQSEAASATRNVCTTLCSMGRAGSRPQLRHNWPACPAPVPLCQPSLCPRTVTYPLISLMSMFLQAPKMPPPPNWIRRAAQGIKAARR